MALAPRARRVVKPTSPTRIMPLSLPGVPRRRRSSERQHAQTLFGHRVFGARKPARLRGRRAARPGVELRPRSQNGSTDLERALAVEHAPVRRIARVDMRLRSVSNGISSAARKGAEPPAASGHAGQRHFHRVAEQFALPLFRRRSGCGNGARSRRTARDIRSARRGAAPNRRNARRAKRRFTDMRFWVSVPVLSVQMTVVEPSVSTAGRWRISALRLAMRWVAMASASVTVGNRPSGTLATMMPMANNKVGPERSPSAWPMKKNNTPSASGEERDHAREARDLALQRRTRCRSPA